MATKLQLTPIGQELVDALKDALDGAFVFLIDDTEKCLHLSMPRRWFSCQRTRAELQSHGELQSRGCHLEVAVNARWSIYVAAKAAPYLHHDAKRLLTWVAAKLEPHLPPLPALGFRDPPTGGDGGPSGSAEIGIPVSWARRARS